MPVRIPKGIAARQDEDVNLGVAKKPEQVHIEHRVATTPWVESGGVSVAIGEEHRESTRKHGQGEHPTNPISPKRIKNATKRAKSAMASERAKPKMAYPKSCFESDGLRDTE